MRVRVSGRFKNSSDVQFISACMGRTVSVFGRWTLFSAVQPERTAPPTAVTESGNAISRSAVQDANARYSMVSSPSFSVMLVSAEQPSKALPPMWRSVLGSVTAVRSVRMMNAHSPTLTTGRLSSVSGRLISPPCP